MTTATPGSRSHRRGGVGPFEGLLASVVAAVIRLTVPPRPPRPAIIEGTSTGSTDTSAPGGPKGWLVRLGARRGWRWLGRALEIQDRFSEIHGSGLASALTLTLFLSLFPLLLVAAAVAGFLQAGGTDVAGRVISELGLTGTAADTVRESIGKASESRRATSILGFVGLLWSGLGLAAGVQLALNSVWGVDGRGIKDKPIGLAWLLGAAILFAGSTAVTAVVGWLPDGLAPVALLGSLATSFGLWVWTLKWLPNLSLSFRDVLPGAIVGTIGLEALKLVGAVWVPRAVASSSQLYGALGIVFAILAWLLVFGRLVVYSGVVCVISREHRRPKPTHRPVTAQVLPGRQ